MNGDVATSSVGTGHAGELLELPPADLVTDGSRSPVPAAHRIENFAVGMQGQESGRTDLGRQLGGSELTVVRVEGGVVDTLRTAAARPEEDVERLGQANAES